jgi:hypothetical protein
MRGKQVKALRKAMKERFKFTLSVKDGYKDDLRVGTTVEKMVYFNPLTKQFVKNLSKMDDSEKANIIKTKVTRVTAVNAAKTQYKMAKKGLKAALKG